MATASKDVVLLFLARGLRLFGYGTTGLLLALHLSELGLSDDRIGALLYVTMLGDAAISLLVTMFADRLGRRAMLLLGFFLKLLGGATLASISGPHFWLLAFGCTIGVISPSGNEVGPFLAVEQAALAEQVHPQSRTMVFAWHTFLGSCTSALGSLFAGFFTTWLVEQYHVTVLDSYRTIFVQYGAIAAVLMVLVCMLSSRIDRSQALRNQLSQDDASSLSQPLYFSSSPEDISLRTIAPPTPSGYDADPAAPAHKTGFVQWAQLDDDDDGLLRRTASWPFLVTRMQSSYDAEEARRGELETELLQPRGSGGLESEPAAAGNKHDAFAADLILEPVQRLCAAASVPTSFRSSSTGFSSKGSTSDTNLTDPGSASDEEDEQDERAVLLKPLHAKRTRCSKALPIPISACKAMALFKPPTAAQLNAKLPVMHALNAASQTADVEAGGLPAVLAAPTASMRGRTSKGAIGLSRQSRGKVLHLCSLFLLDSFGSGMINGSLLVYWLQVTWELPGTSLGSVLFGASLVGGFSSLASGWVASKLGLVNTMVFTHLPSSVFLMLVPVMPSAQLAVAMIFLRYSISQMDVVPRQSYVSGFVSEDERTVTLGITNIVRSLGSACSPLVTGWLAANGLFDWAFLVSGSVQVLYDLLLLWSFSHQKAEHE